MQARTATFSCRPALTNNTKYISIYEVRHNSSILMHLLMLCKTCRVRAALYTIKPTIPLISQADAQACVIQQGYHRTVEKSVEGLANQEASSLATLLLGFGVSVRHHLKGWNIQRSI